MGNGGYSEYSGYSTVTQYSDRWINGSSYTDDQVNVWNQSVSYGDNVSSE